MHFLVHLEDILADTIAGHVSEESGHQKKEYFAEIGHSSGRSKLEVDREGKIYCKPKI